MKKTQKTLKNTGPHNVPLSIYVYIYIINYYLPLLTIILWGLGRQTGRRWPGGGPARLQGLAAPYASHLRQGEWAPDGRSGSWSFWFSGS